jgi:predicted CXXCH cytochrome family protein
MRAHVSFITRDAAKGVARRSSHSEGDTLLIGREANAAVYLPDPRILMRHAVIEATPLGFGLRALGWTPLGEGSAQTERLALAPGVSSMIGPYRLTVEPPIDGFDLALSLELIHPQEEGGTAAVERLMASITPRAPSLRSLSWICALVVLLLAATLPFVNWTPTSGGQVLPAANASMTESTRMLRTTLSAFWSVGTISNAHRSFAVQCEICHTGAFTAVTSETCISCHQDIAQHADPHLFPATDLSQQSCESCHLEHKGPKQAIRADEAFCTSCHADIHAGAPRSRLLDVGNFSTSHPDFRVQIVDDPGSGTMQRVSLGTATPPTSHDNLIFSHQVHLDPKGILSPQGMTQLSCASCHTTENGGRRMKPIVMEEHCASCHDLRFEPRHPEWVLPHGQPQRVVDEIQSHYSQMALAGEATGIASSPLVMRPGAPGPSEQEAASWARDRTIEALASTFGKSACGLCHQVNPPTGSDPLAWTVDPVLVPTTYLPKANFSHAEHATQPCTQCHDAPHATENSPVMLPSISVCRSCHGDEHAPATQVATTCTTCHSFHATPPTNTPRIADSLRKGTP